MKKVKSAAICQTAMNAILENWPVALFHKSVLKQHKLKEITSLLGNTDSLVCLDIGSDNGVISYLLRQRGGSWKSADLDENAVHAIICHSHCKSTIRG